MKSNFYEKVSKTVIPNKTGGRFRMFHGRLCGFRWNQEIFRRFRGSQGTSLNEPETSRYSLKLPLNPPKIFWYPRETLWVPIETPLRSPGSPINSLKRRWDLLKHPWDGFETWWYPLGTPLWSLGSPLKPLETPLTPSGTSLRLFEAFLRPPEAPPEILCNAPEVRLMPSETSWV